MMTLIGKLLAVVNLLIGIALVTWSVSLYTQRPGWFDKKAEGGVSAGQYPMSFESLKEEIDLLGRAATAASGNWGAQRKVLDDLEKKRADRQKEYAVRLDWTQNGNPNKDGAGFFEPVYEARSGLLDLTTVGEPIKGSDNLPLKGVGKLGATFNADVEKAAAQTKLITNYRDQFKALGIEILNTEKRLLKIGEIRDSVQAELFYLETFEVNVYETRETVLRRKRQLTSRLAELGLKP
jgi:hypothetical protein